jgi:pimeloyl-ACP methyl ester carboxylesterase
LDSNAPVELERHVEDALHVLDAFGAERAVAVGYCTGARLSLRIAHSHHSRLRALVLLSGGYSMPDLPQTSFERTMAEMMPRIARDARTARMIHSAVFRRGLTATGVAADSEAAKLLSITDPELLRMSSLPFQDPQSLTRYARLVCGFLRDPPSADELATDLPTLVMSGRADSTTSPLASELLAEKLTNSKFIGIEGADHFGLYASDQYRRELVSFIDELA